MNLDSMMMKLHVKKSMLPVVLKFLVFSKRRLLSPAKYARVVAREILLQPNRWLYSAFTLFFPVTHRQQ